MDAANLYAFTLLQKRTRNMRETAAAAKANGSWLPLVRDLPGLANLHFGAGRSDFGGHLR